MFLFDDLDQARAIDKEGDCFKVALLSKVKGKVCVDKLDTLSTSEDVKRVYTLSSLPVFSALPASAILVRSLEIPKTRDRDLASVLRFQMEPLLPYPVDESLLTFIKQQEQEGKTLLKVLAAKKESLVKHLEELKVCGQEPTSVSSVPSALTAFVRHRFPRTKTIVIHVAYEETSCVYVDQGKLMAAHSIPIGARHLKTQGTVTTPVEIDGSKVLEKWVREASRLIFALQKQSPIEQALLTGYANEIEGLSACLMHQLSCRLVPAEEDHAYAVPVGIALAKLNYEDASIEFRQEEFAFHYPLSHYLKPVGMLFVLSCLFSLLIFFAFQFYFGQREEQLKMNYGKLILASKPSLAAFEQEFRTKNRLPPIDENEIKLEQFSQDELQSRLIFFEKQLKSTPEMFPLQPNTPRVADFLAWLNSHPQVVKTSKTGEKEVLLHIEAINYILVKHPDHNHKGEKYQVKVDLEFTANSPTEARQFHDALIAPNAMVDPKGDVKWNATKDRYHASFFLKDKTAYPSLSTGGQGR